MAWQLGFGDPTLAGWLITLSYLIAFGICIQVVSAHNNIFARKRSKQRLLWVIISLLMLFLALNKQLDLQTLLTDIGKSIFEKSALHEDRRKYQTLFVLSVASIFVIAIFAIFIELLTVLKKHLLAIAGLGLIALFILYRAASIHHFADFFEYEILSFQFRDFVEISGIILIILNGVFLLQKK